MFISKLESLESRGNHSLTSKRGFKNAKIHGPVLRPEVKSPCQFRFCFPYSWLI